MATDQVKRIPYGLADYRRLRRDNSYYVDKTRFIPLIEAEPYFLFLLRPRRFGKSLWLSVLQYYYDINYQAEFDALFGGTYIGAQPTAERNSYLVMFFNFSAVNPDLRQVQASFEDNGRFVIHSFLDRYNRFFNDAERQEIHSGPTVEAQLQRIFYYCDQKGLKTYLLIDEYDNFANSILATEGQTAYQELTHGGGFFRYFFNLLKSATAGQTAGLTRLFITGVSPVTMDDVTSGFNIGTNISIDPRFSELIGFTHAETHTLLAYYADGGFLPFLVEEHFSLIKAWYNHYHFSKNSANSVFNADMILYFVLQANALQQLPDDLIDPNVRIDYTKLRHLITLNKRLNGNFDQLKAIIETGETISPIHKSFPVQQLHDRENFLSLLYFFGLLTLAGEREGQPLLCIPNRTIKDLLYSYIRDGYRDVDIFRIDFGRLANLLGDMVYRGQWQPLFDFLTAEIQKQVAVRDYLNGEKVVQTFLLAYLNVTHLFLTWTEREMAGGFVDLYLEPFLARYPDMRYGYLIELKYIARNEFTAAKLQEKITAAQQQLQTYAHDERIQQVAQQVTLKKLVLVYHGWELVYREEYL